MDQETPEGQKDIPKLATQEEERVNALQNYVYQGGKLIAEGKFPEAIKHFRNKEEVEKAGLDFSLNREVMLDNITPDNVESTANLVAMNSWFKNGRTINPSGVWVSGRHIKDLPSEQMSTAEKSLAHEVALVHMEEFLHGLQHLKGRPLAGYHDNEVDVAAYMQRSNIPLTDAFLARYDRGQFLTGKEGNDDTAITRPALRRGVFVNVRRSDGNIEQDWQIAGFDTTSGEPLVRNYSQGLEKKLTREELAELNKVGLQPFETSKDITEVFTTLDQLKKVHGSFDVYEAQQLKSLVNQVRVGKEDINKIPRSGGLRMKVAELLSQSSSASLSSLTVPL